MIGSQGEVDVDVTVSRQLVPSRLGSRGIGHLVCRACLRRFLLRIRTSQSLTVFFRYRANWYRTRLSYREESTFKSDLGIRRYRAERAVNRSRYIVIWCICTAYYPGRMHQHVIPHGVGVSSVAGMKTQRRCIPVISTYLPLLQSRLVQENDRALRQLQVRHHQAVRLVVLVCTGGPTPGSATSSEARLRGAPTLVVSASPRSLVTPTPRGRSKRTQPTQMTARNTVLEGSCGLAPQSNQSPPFRLG